MKSMSNSRRILFRTAFYTIGTLLVALWLIPILIAIFTSLKSMDEIMSSPRM
jgi:multiple sugar transport system permease protein